MALKKYRTARHSLTPPSTLLLPGVLVLRNEGDMPMGGIGGHVGLVVLPVAGGHFQLSEFIGQLTSLLQEHALQVVPLLTRAVGAGVSGDHGDDGEVPLLLPVCQ